MESDSIGIGLSREERETVIAFHEGSDTLEISTSSPVFVRRLEKLHESMGFTLERRSPWDIRATLPIQSLRINRPIQLSDEERERRADRLRQRRAVAE